MRRKVYVEEADGKEQPFGTLGLWLGLWLNISMFALETILKPISSNFPMKDFPQIQCNALPTATCCRCHQPELLQKDHREE